jgi:predicted tellurium resistance membrane protein TerC
MNLIAFSQWLSSTPLSQLIQSTSWAIPGIQFVHILCLATLFALALNFSLRIAGRGLAAEPLRSLAGRFVPAIWICLALLLLTGTLLIIAEPDRTITNPAFYIKMTLLVVAIGLTLWLASVARRENQVPTPVHVAAATLSMLIWAGIIVAGRYIAYVERV